MYLSRKENGAPVNIVLFTATIEANRAFSKLSACSICLEHLGLRTFYFFTRHIWYNENSRDGYKLYLHDKSWEEKVGSRGCHLVPEVVS